MYVQIISTMKNESQNLNSFIDLIQDLHAIHMFAGEAIVVNNGSTDDTDSVIATLPDLPFVKFLVNPKNSTYADGLERAISEAVAPYVLIVPCDLQFDKYDILNLLHVFYTQLAYSSSNKIVVISDRKIRLDGSFNKFRGYLWRFIVCKVLSLNSDIDPASQLRIIPNPKGIKFTSRNFLWDIESLIWALKTVPAYIVVGVKFHPRVYGVSNSSSKVFRSALTALIGLNAIRSCYKD